MLLLVCWVTLFCCSKISNCNLDKSWDAQWVTLIVVRASSVNNIRTTALIPIRSLDYVAAKGWGRMTCLAFKGNCGHREPVWTGINYQSVYRREGEITKAIQDVLTNKPPESCQWMQTDSRLWLWHWPLLKFRLESISEAEWSSLCLCSVLTHRSFQQ